MSKSFSAQDRLVYGPVENKYGSKNATKDYCKSLNRVNLADTINGSDISHVRTAKPPKIYHQLARSELTSSGDTAFTGFRID